MYSPEEQMRAWVLFFLGLHDIGKFDVRFQLKAREAFDALHPGFDYATVSLRDAEGYAHGPAGFAWFNKDYQCVFGVHALDNHPHATAWQRWLSAVTGHHGILPRDGGAGRVDGRYAKETIKAFDRAARAEWLAALEALLLKPFGLCLHDTPPAVSQPLLGGFCSVCDWLGSNDTPGYFEYNAEVQGLPAYFHKRLAIAEKALTMAGIVQQPLSVGGFDRLYELEARQVQPLVAELPAIQSLTLIEAPTGSGKTEAALAYASRLLAVGLAESVIFALPTQATANAMLERLEQIAVRLYPDAEAPVNLILAHGKARYNPHFDDLKAKAKERSSQGRENAAVHCAEWLAQSRKRAFLGQIGVCTVDQVLLSVLPVKHSFVRGFGIGKSVLIVDEVHAYDSYMYGLLAETLKCQREAGGSAILLSATLPYHQRQMLLESWDGEAMPEAPYPLITQTDAQGTTTPWLLPTHQQPLSRTVTVAAHHSPDMLPNEALLGDLIDAAKVGAKVAVICNLVADAQALAQRLRAMTGLPVEIFHSRYRFLDRQKKELEALRAYGKAREPGGRILIATQVVEQSLDLDFDWLATQLCPMDLLFQRLGRLHRHERVRPTGLETPHCTILAPEDSHYGKSQEAVYCKAVLWRTEQLLKDRSTLEFPSAYRPLIERVYQEMPWDEPAEPEAISKAFDEHLGQAMANRREAEQLTRMAINPFDDEDDKVTVLTRSGEGSLQVLLVSQNGASPMGQPDCRLDALEPWDRAEIVNRYAVPVPASWRKDLPQALDGVIRLPMHESGDGLWRGETATIRYTYSLDFGLVKEKP